MSAKRPRNRRVRRGRKSDFDRADPPAILPNPWNALVVELNWAGASSANYVMTLQGLHDLILAQIGISLTDRTGLAFRIKEVGLWELSGKGLDVSFHDLDDRFSLDADFASLSQKLDTPGRNHFAHIHFRWPVDNRNNVMRADGEPANFEIIAVHAGTETAGDARIKAYIRVCWKTQAFETPGRIAKIIHPNGLTYF